MGAMATVMDTVMVTTMARGPLMPMLLPWLKLSPAMATAMDTDTAMATVMDTVMVTTMARGLLNLAMAMGTVTDTVTAMAMDTVMDTAIMVRRFYLVIPNMYIMSRVQLLDLF